MRSLSLWIPFCLACIFALWGGVMFPQAKVWVFSPFLAITFHRLSFSRSLWISFFCGLLIDCLSSQFSFGWFACVHVLGTFFLFRRKRHFFEDKPFALSFYSALLSLFFSSSVLLLSFWHRKIPITPPLLFSELLFMPFLDALYAFLWFTCPLSLIAYVKKRGFKPWFSRAKESI